MKKMIAILILAASTLQGCAAIPVAGLAVGAASATALTVPGAAEKMGLADEEHPSKKNAGKKKPAKKKLVKKDSVKKEVAKKQ